MILCRTKQVGVFLMCSVHALPPPFAPLLGGETMPTQCRRSCIPICHSDNLAVSAQGFRRNANRVRKVRSCFLFRTVLELNISHRTCGKF